jgi:hypothetical protein
MAIGGLVLTLSSSAPLQRAALRFLHTDPRLEIGLNDGARLAAVATTDTLGEGRDLCEALTNHPGIDRVEVAYVATEEEEDEPAAASAGADAR